MTNHSTAWGKLYKPTFPITGGSLGRRKTGEEKQWQCSLLLTGQGVLGYDNLNCLRKRGGGRQDESSVPNSLTFVWSFTMANGVQDFGFVDHLGVTKGFEIDWKDLHNEHQHNKCQITQFLSNRAPCCLKVNLVILNAKRFDDRHRFKVFEARECPWAAMELRASSNLCATVIISTK